MATIYIDDKKHEVKDGQNLLEICLSLGYDLTYFCWHPALHSVGACRQCAVVQYKDENDTKGKIVMACMQEATDNIRISLQNKKGIDFRAGNIEALMINHPHDCPVCDEGGECHLQDMTVMSGHNYRRYRFNKRTHKNQYLGPFINHEMNRCIQCYRCVRYYKDYAGGKDLDVFASHDNVYFGRSEEGTLESEFSGNLVEVCPTGVFTDKTLRQHYTRKWDLKNAPSICHECSVGCNFSASERYGTLRRVINRYNGDVNGYFLCDRGRFGYEYVNSKKRITHSRKRSGLQQGIDAFSDLKNYFTPGIRVIGIGSPRASLESNYLLKKLVGENNFYHGITAAEGKLIESILSNLQNGNVRTPSLAEIATYDTVFVLGEDVTNTAPMMALALRQANKNVPRQKAYDMKIPHWNDAAIREVVQDAKGPFYTATPYATKLDEIATQTFFGNTHDLLEVSQMLVSIFRGEKKIPNTENKLMTDFAGRLARALLDGKKPLIVSGTGMMSEEIINASSAIASALKDLGKDVGLSYTVPESNSLGVALLGRKYLDDAFEDGERSTVIILENDLYLRAPKNTIDSFFSKCEQVVVLDSIENNTTQQADYVLPAGTFAESDGTIINNEGRAQRYYQVYMPKNQIRSSWAWIDMLLHNSDAARHFDDIISEMISAYPVFEKIKLLAPTADYRIGTQKIPRETHRFSGRTAMNANISVHEPKPPVDVDSPLTFTMEGFHGIPPAVDIPFFWAPGWNSIQSVNKYQREVGGPLKGGNPGIRLIEPLSNGLKTQFFKKEKFAMAEGQFEVLPAYHIFGSGELSAKSPAISDRKPPATIGINEEALAAAGLSGSDSIRIAFNGDSLKLPVKINNSLPKSVLTIPKNFPETFGITFPFYSAIIG